MQVQIAIGENHRFELREALLVYHGNQTTFITKHEVTTQQNTAPTLGPAQPLTVAFAESLVRSLGGGVAAEVFPENILARSDRMIAWWTPAQRRQMFYQHSEGKAAELNGRIFPQPPLVWQVADGQFKIRALTENKRPEAKTKLAVAPYWNLSDNGTVCTGSMRRPQSTSVAAISDWEQGFYESAFTHANVGRLTRHQGGFEGLWGLTGKRTLSLWRPSSSFLRRSRNSFVKKGIEMRIEHSLPHGFLGRRPIHVLVVGVGGTGSAILMGLPYLHQAMRVWGHPYGLNVAIMDSDVVSATNCVRQPFAVSDIGQYKATVLVNRINLFWGLNWSAVARPFSERTLRGNDISTPDLLIGCVDTRAARRSIDEVLSGLGATYWLDLGNNAASGQYVLGQPLNRANRRKADRLRTVSELYPEIVDAAAGEDDLPSCSAREALERQEPFINQTLAASALAMLSQLFRYGKLGHHGGFFNAQTGRMSALPIDPRMWAKARRRNRHVFSGGVHGIERSKLHP